MKITHEGSAMALITDWICAATVGKLWDRDYELTEHLLNGLAESYNTDIYTANINHNHLRFSDGGYGHVADLKIDQSPTGKKGLFVRLALSSAGHRLIEQKTATHCSIEFVEKWMDTDQPYLVGLALTNNPAAVGTEKIELSAEDCDTLKTLPIKLSTNKFKKKLNQTTFKNHKEPGMDEHQIKQLTDKITEAVSLRIAEKINIQTLSAHEEKQQKINSSAHELLKSLTGTVKQQGEAITELKADQKELIKKLSEAPVSNSGVVVNGASTKDNSLSEWM